MTVTLGGPMFLPAQDEFRSSVFGKSGGHYNTFASRDPDKALRMLREWFSKKGAMNEMNFILFSTSGIHGMYTTIEECERSIRKYGPVPPEVDDDSDDYHPREVTFLLVQPRIVSMTYGNATCRTLDDVKFLKRLRAASWKAMQKIGRAK